MLNVFMLTKHPTGNIIQYLILRKDPKCRKPKEKRSSGRKRICQNQIVPAFIAYSNTKKIRFVSTSNMTKFY